MTNMPNTTKTKVVGIIRNKWFVKGFNDYKNNLPFDESIPSFYQWTYERGRLFGVLYNKPIKFGKKVSPDAVETFSWFYNIKAII